MRSTLAALLALLPAVQAPLSAAPVLRAVPPLSRAPVPKVAPPLLTPALLVPAAVRLHPVPDLLRTAPGGSSLHSSRPLRPAARAFPARLKELKKRFAAPARAAAGAAGEHGRWSGLMDGAGLRQSRAPAVPAAAAPRARPASGALSAGRSPGRPSRALERAAPSAASRPRRSLKSAFFVARSVVRPLLSLFYRLRRVGSKNVPEKGPVLLAGNHPSYLDPVLLAAATDRPIRFLMYRNYYEKRGVRWLMEKFGVIPVAPPEPGNGPKAILRSLAAAREALKAGDVVAIFSEGKVSVDGGIHPFQRGLEYVLQGTDATLVPFHIDGPFGTMFSKRPLPWLKRLFQWPKLMTVRFGPPLEERTTGAAELAVRGLASDPSSAIKS